MRRRATPVPGHAWIPGRPSPVCAAAVRRRPPRPGTPCRPHRPRPLPHPRDSPGASASPSRIASRREAPLLLRVQAPPPAGPPPPLLHPRRLPSPSSYLAPSRRQPLLRPTLSPLLGPSPTSPVPRSRLTSPDPSQLERDKPATLPLPSAAGRTAPPGPRRS